MTIRSSNNQKQNYAMYIKSNVYFEEILVLNKYILFWYTIYLFANLNLILCIYLLVYLNYHQIFNLSYWTYCKRTILATWLWQIVYRNEIKRDKKLKIFSFYAAAAINGKIILLSGCFAVRSLPPKCSSV